MSKTRSTTFLANAHAACSFLLLAFGLLLGACTSSPPVEEEVEIFYPPPPAEPRFKFVRSLRYSSNVQPTTAADRLRTFATGESDEFRGLAKPFDVAVWNQRVYVTDTIQSRVILFDLAGGRYLEFGMEPPGDLRKPLGIDVAPNGDVYVVDAAIKRVKVYDSEGNYKRAIVGTDVFERAADVAVDSPRNRLYVVDTGGVESDHHGIHVFELDSGKFLRSTNDRGEKENQFNLPLLASVAPDGTLYVVDSGNFRVVAYDSNSHFLRTFGKLGRYPGQFARPKGIAVDANGLVYVVDTAFGNFQIFTPQGELLLFVGQRGQSSKPGNYMLPAGIDVDSDGNVYVVDQFFRKVDIYAPVSNSSN